jgi:hypothetical protein
MKFDRKEVMTLKDDNPEYTSWVYEILMDYKKSAKRWFIAFLCTLAILALFIGGLVAGGIYIVTHFEFATEDTTITQDSEGENYSIVGSEGVIFGSENQD